MKSAEDVLRAVFETVIEQARRDPRFAERLIEALGKEVALTRPKRARAEVRLPPELESLDLDAMVAAEGRRKAQQFLLDGPFTVPMLREFARRRKSSLRGVGRRKVDIVGALLAASAGPRAAAFG